MKPDYERENTAGRLIVHGSHYGGWWWTIHVSPSAKPFRDDVRLVSRWHYATRTSATAAGKRWAKRLAVKLL